MVPFLWDLRNRKDFEILKQPYKTLLDMGLIVPGAPVTDILFQSVLLPNSVVHQPGKVSQLPMEERMIVISCLSNLNLKAQQKEVKICHWVRRF